MIDKIEGKFDLSFELITDKASNSKDELSEVDNLVLIGVEDTEEVRDQLWVAEQCYWIAELGNVDHSVIFLGSRDMLVEFVKMFNFLVIEVSYICELI